jgi:hypothetical protein
MTNNISSKIFKNILVVYLMIISFNDLVYCFQIHNDSFKEYFDRSVTRIKEGTYSIEHQGMLVALLSNTFSSGNLPMNHCSLLNGMVNYGLSSNAMSDELRILFSDYIKICCAARILGNSNSLSVFANLVNYDIDKKYDKMAKVYEVVFDQLIVFLRKGIDLKNHCPDFSEIYFAMVNQSIHYSAVKDVLREIFFDYVCISIPKIQNNALKKDVRDIFFKLFKLCSEKSLLTNKMICIYFEYVMQCHYRKDELLFCFKFYQSCIAQKKEIPESVKIIFPWIYYIALSNYNIFSKNSWEILQEEVYRFLLYVDNDPVLRRFVSTGPELAKFLTKFVRENSSSCVKVEDFFLKQGFSSADIAHFTSFMNDPKLSAKVLISSFVSSFFQKILLKIGHNDIRIRNYNMCVFHQPNKGRII